MCIFKHYFVNNSYLLHSFSYHIILYSKRSAIFFYQRILFKGECAITYLSIFVHPFYLVFWCIFVRHPVNIYTSIFFSSVPICVLSFPKYNSIIFSFNSCIFSLLCCEWWSLSCSSKLIMAFRAFTS